jgi:hypothetical protein
VQMDAEVQERCIKTWDLPVDVLSYVTAG